MKTTCIIKTKKGTYASNDRDLGLACNWTTDKSAAMRMDKATADRLMRGLNILIPGHASIEEIETEVSA